MSLQQEVTVNVKLVLGPDDAAALITHTPSAAASANADAFVVHSTYLCQLVQHAQFVIAPAGMDKVECTTNMFTLVGAVAHGGLVMRVNV